jgi:DNA-damage-inducible protein D
MKDKTQQEITKQVNDMPMDEVLRTVAAVQKAASQSAPNRSDDNTVAYEGECQLTLFNRREIRKVFHKSEWYFSVVDVIGAIAETTQPRRYWSELKTQLTAKEGFTQLFAHIEQLKMQSSDGKHYLTDAVNVETLFRLIQSIPSPKAEPFKRWLARVGYERIEEFQNPEIAIKRAMVNWRIQGRTDDWIEARLRSIVVRHELTSEWAKRGIEEGIQYGQLTNIISKETFGLKTQEHKKLKSLAPSHNLRDHMTDFELVLTMLGEKTTAAIAQTSEAQGFQQNAIAARSGGRVAGNTRKELEEQLGRPIVSTENFLKEKPIGKKLPSV